MIENTPRTVESGLKRSSLPSETRLPEGELDLRVPRSVRRAKLLRLAAAGVPAKRAAEVLGLSLDIVRLEYKDVEFRRMVLEAVNAALGGVDEALETEQLTLYEKLKLKSDDAFQVLCELMDDKDTHPAIRARVAQDILDRNPDTQAGSVVRHGVLTDPQVLAAAAQVAREMDNVIPIKREA